MCLARIRLHLDFNESRPHKSPLAFHCSITEPVTSHTLDTDIVQPIIVVEILQKILGILNIHVHNSCFSRLNSDVLFIVFCFSMHRYYKRPICIQFNAATTAKLFYIASYLKLYEINILQTNKACHQRLKRSNSRFFF